MGILANLQHDPPAKARRCRFYEWRSSLDPEDQEAVETMLADHRWAVDHLVQAFTDSGCPVGYSRIRAHRLDLCEPCNRRDTT